MRTQETKAAAAMEEVKMVKVTEVVRAAEAMVAAVTMAKAKAVVAGMEVTGGVAVATAGGARVTEARAVARAVVENSSRRWESKIGGQHKRRCSSERAAAAAAASSGRRAAPEWELMSCLVGRRQRRMLLRQVPHSAPRGCAFWLSRAALGRWARPPHPIQDRVYVEWMMMSVFPPPPVDGAAETGGLSSVAPPYAAPKLCACRHQWLHASPRLARLTSEKRWSHPSAVTPLTVPWRVLDVLAARIEMDKG